MTQKNSFKIRIRKTQKWGDKIQEKFDSFESKCILKRTQNMKQFILNTKQFIYKSK